MQQPKIAARHSIKVEVIAGTKYKWCACGMSSTQPFCDGSHNGSEFVPIEYIAEESKLIGFCGCKYSKNVPICDGSHKTLTE